MVSLAPRGTLGRPQGRNPPLSDSLSVYEDWVRALRSWRQDPLTEMRQLPPLDASSFPPATYQRFVNHLNSAINDFMKRWQAQLSSMLGAATSDHARARALIDARVGLVERLNLARHPGLPEEVRKQLTMQAESDIRSLQAQLETEATHVVAVSSSSNRPQREATLRLIRDNALTAVLEPGFSLDGTINDSEFQRADSVAQAAQEASPAVLQDFVPRRPKRRIFDPESEE